MRNSFSCSPQQFFFKYIVEKHITSCSLAKLQSSNNSEITVGAAKRKELN